VSGSGKKIRSVNRRRQVTLKQQSGKMPRTSEKARIVHQLDDIWLSNTIVESLFDDRDDLSLFFTFLAPLTAKRLQISRDANLDLYSALLDNPVFSNVNPNNLPESWCGSNEEGFGEDLMEVIELLGLGISMIRYFMPRDSEPIPCSEYMFNHHVCNK